MALLTLAAFVFMEFVAWFSHKYVMHGFLWVLHKDHHNAHKTRFEKNDWFAVLFAVPSALFIYLGIKNGLNHLFFIGLGSTLYGIAYFLFHELLVHKRLPFFKRPNGRFLKSIYTAHLDHHTKGNRNFGFLFFIPFKYYFNK